MKLHGWSWTNVGQFFLFKKKTTSLNISKHQNKTSINFEYLKKIRIKELVDSRH